MWLLMKRLLVLTVSVLITTTVSAQAALTFGAAPAADSLIQSVPQAQRFGAYLEKHLDEPVDVRIFPSAQELKETLNAFYDIDLAVVPGNLPRQQPEHDFKKLAGTTRKTTSLAKADMVVFRQGLDQTRLSRIRTVLSNMEKDPEGHALLYNLGIQRFSLAANTQPVTPPPTGKRRSTPQPASFQPPVASPVQVPQTFTLGMVADPDSPLRSKEVVEDFAKSLGQQIKSPVKVRIFKDETALHDWLNRYRMIELGLFSDNYLRKHPAGTFEILAQPADLTAQGLPTDSSLVARQGFDSSRLALLRHGLEQLKGAPLAPLPTPSTLPATVAVTAPLPIPEVIRHTRASGVSKNSTPPVNVSETQITFGAVVSADAPFHSEDQVKAFGRLFEQRLGLRVDVRTFKDQRTLHEWLNHYRMVDVGLFNQAYLQKQPAGEFISLHPLSDLGGPSGSRLVGCQGFELNLLARVRDALQGMTKDPETARFFKPSATAAPAAPAKSKPVAVKPSAPVLKPTIPETPPETKIQPPPSIPKPEPVAPTPPVVVETLPPLPQAPQVAPPAAPPQQAPTPPAQVPEPPRAEPKESATASQPESPELVFRSTPDRKQVYLVPFITVMVPGSVAEQIFDSFVDKLNADGMNRQYEFTILKGGINSVDPGWLAQRDYVTGEIYGYVEESGCCSTDIRTKSRVFLYRNGKSVPVLRYEHPVKIFFDHDYSTIDKERRNIAENIANELASKVRDALRIP